VSAIGGAFRENGVPFRVAGSNSLSLAQFSDSYGVQDMLSRMVRAAVAEVLNEEFICAAYARGLSAQQVLWRHALRNAALPVLTIIGMQLGALLGGAVVTEMVFGWAGLGQRERQALWRQRGQTQASLRVQDPSASPGRDPRRSRCQARRKDTVPPPKGSKCRMVFS
jgi:hypothetical protein